MAFTKIAAAGIGSTETVTVDGLDVINNGSFGGTLSVTGSVSVGGTLTYEDVTNVDSVGLITARSGIVVGSGITLSPDGDIFTTGISTFGGNIQMSVTNPEIEMNVGGPRLRVPAANTLTIHSGAGLGSADEERVRFTAGKVGINTTSPEYALDLRMDNDVASGIIQIIRNNTANGNGSFYCTDLAQVGNFSFGMPDNTNAFTIVDGLGNSGDERIRINSAGLVGIGTDNPLSRLHLTGRISVHHSVVDTEGEFLRIGRTDLPLIRYHSLKARHGGGAAANFISFLLHDSSDVTSQTEVFRLRGDGYVGIGTTVPNHKLHIQGDNPTLALESNSTTGNTNIVFGDGGGETQGRIQYHNNGDYMRFYTSGDERLRIASDGTVGIGTDSPQVHLNVSNPTTLGGTTGNRQDIARFEGHVANDGMLEFANVRLTNGADWQTTTFRIQRRIDSTRMGYIDFGTGSGSGAGGAGRDIQFGSGEGRIMLQLDSAGSVGVGTAAPAVRLDVRNDSGTSADTEPLVALHHSVHDVDGEVLRIGRTDLPTIRYHSLFSEHSGGASSNTLKFYMHTGSAGASASSTRQVLTLQGNGRVGIGTTNGGLEAALEVCSDEGAFIKSFTNATPARVRFSDHASGGAYDQLMTIDYKHSNNQVVDGTAEGLHIFGSESSTAVRIDGLLRITEQPCAVVYQASGPAGGAIDGSSDDAEPIHFDHVHINQGGMAISDDNARITVPVPGNYLVSGMISGTVTTPNVNDGIELIFLVDGSEAISNNSRIEPVDNFGTTAGQSEYAFINTTILTLAENDFVELAVHSVGDADASVTRGHLSVALLN